MRPRRIARPFAYAASPCAVASVLALLAFGGPDSKRSAATLRDANPIVRYGSGATRRAVTLDDGTRVYLDVASIIEVRFDATRRDVTLVQGRALFDAAHDSTRPFVVTVGTERVTALGTVFQVDREPSEVVVTLAQGAVTVTSQEAEAVQLAPGEELRSSAGSTRWSKRSVDAQSATSWSSGKHIFRERRLGVRSARSTATPTRECGWRIHASLISSSTASSIRATASRSSTRCDTPCAS